MVIIRIATGCEVSELNFYFDMVIWILFSVKSDFQAQIYVVINALVVEGSFQYVYVRRGTGLQPCCASFLFGTVERYNDMHGREKEGLEMAQIIVELLL